MEFLVRVDGADVYDLPDDEATALIGKEREPGGILFELTTEGPGLTFDVDTDTLGQSLYLPPSLEENREMIEGQLQPLELPPALKPN